MDEITVVVIPAFNEENTIKNVIRGLKRYVTHIVVVNDASNDNTRAIAKEEGALIVDHSKNRGYDKSLDDGFILASKLGADVIITFDADDQHDPNDVPKFIKPILQGKFDIIVGKRPEYARISEYLFSFISKRKASIDDPLCGFKAYNIKVYDEVGYFDKISSIGTQLMFEGAKRGFKVGQVKINLKEREDESRFGKRFIGNWRIFKAILRVYFYLFIN